MQHVFASAKRSMLFLALVVFLSPPLFAATFPLSQPQQMEHGLPVEFEPNRGQAPPEVHYIARTADGEAQLMADRLRIVQSTAGAPSAVELYFPGAKPDQIRDESPAGGFVNYYNGRSQAAWIAHVPLYRQIRYQNIYPGTDLVFHGKANRLEYDFELSAGTDPEHLQIGLNDSSKIQPQQDGSLLITSGSYSLRLLAPSAFQQDGAKTKPVTVAYQMLSPSRIGFAIGSYDHTKELVIDPVVTYANLLAVNSSIQVAAIATDANGDLIMTGNTSVNSYPVVNGQPGSSSGSQQVVVTKLDPTGANILYSTYLPASAFNTASGVAVDGNGNAYVIGITDATDFPVTSQNLGTCGSFCNAGFITKLDSTGALAYSTLLASGQILPKAITVNANGNAFVSGLASDGSLQTVNAFQPSYQASVCTGCNSAFYAELNTQGTGYVFASYLGANNNATGIALDNSGNIYVAGSFNNYYQSSIPLKGELQSGIGSLFLTKFASDGKTLLFGSFLGGENSSSETPETLSGIAVGSDGTVYLAGDTTSYGFPYTINAYRHPLGRGLYGSAQMFAMALNPSLTALTYSTYLGDGFMNAMTVDSQGNLYAAGSTGSDPIQANNAVVSDVVTGGVFLELDKTGKPVETSAFGGHTTTQIPTAMTIDSLGNIYLAGNPGGSNGLTSTGLCSGQDLIVVGSSAYSTEANLGSACVSTGAGFFAKIAPSANPQISLGYQLPFLALRNVGSADLHISDITFTGGLAKNWGNCGNTVPAGTSCVFTLTDANGKMAQGSVTITSDASPSVQTFTPYLDPQAVGNPVPDYPWFDLSQLYFPPQQTGTSSVAHPFRIWNLGAANLALQSIAAQGTLLQTHDCIPTLSPGSYCTVQVVWKPTDGTVGGGSVSVAYDNGIQNYYYVPSLFLSSSTPLMVSETNGIPFGVQTVGNPSFYRTITITNVSNAQADAPSVSLSGDSEFTLAGNTCTSNLAPQQSCIVAALFTPVIDGDRSATLQIGGGASASIQLNGTGQIDSAVTVSPLQLGWPQTVLGSGYSLDETLTNISSVSVPISSITFSLPDYTETDNCAGSIPAASSCTVHVMFQPQDLGARTGTMTINFGDQTNAQVITLLGNSVYPVELSPTSLDFGTNNLVGSSSPAQNVSISNPYSGKTLSYTLSVDGPFTLNNPCPNPLPGFYGCVMSVTFNPTAAGPQTGSLNVSTPGVTLSSSIPLTGTAYTPPTINVTPSLDFGGVLNGTSSTLPLFITDAGSQDLTVSSLAISGTNAADFSIASGQCSTVSGATSCKTNVTFRPSATGTRSAVLTITSNAVNGTQTVPLTGTGQAAAASLSTASLDFGNQNQGTSSAPLQTTLTNSGNGILTITGITSSGDFSQTNNCGTTLAANASCQISVVFTPSTLGAESGTLSIADNASASPQTVSLTGTGTTPSVSIGTSQGGSTISTVPSGQPATYGLVLTGSAGFSGTVTLACSGAPQNATCSVDPTTLALMPGGSQSFAVKVTTQSSTTAYLNNATQVVMAATGIASLLLGSLPLFRRRRAWFPIVLCTVGLFISLAAIGCGGGSSSSNTPPPSTTSYIPAGTYKLTVTATAGMVSTSQTLTLIVQ
ncbi:choice-of-anchor D domain-containing protein [Alloacidobacterium dinghuense]|uniref:Choice-of-anchor D domain-containing protein n=1 Tax=Alloacidobacterium dinghuense TaxID=2763107 RepID=A0A7G8BHH0_9BACT|nr:choice-of-anchor D domain-containing protein [Alloacidobacterium dinghuense]QNI31990.1 choice-of-anchor D domain-containing protein [Alloacidobacterium dinghuense]